MKNLSALLFLFLMSIVSTNLAQEVTADFDLYLEPLRLAPVYDQSTHTYKDSYVNKTSYDVHLNAFNSTDLLGITPRLKECRIVKYHWKITMPNQFAPQVIEHQYEYESEFPELILQIDPKLESEGIWAPLPDFRRRAGTLPNNDLENVNTGYTISPGGRNEIGVGENPPAPRKTFGTALPRLGKVYVKLTVTDRSGETASTTKTFTLKDKLVVVIGDSFASGEGNPKRNCPNPDNDWGNPFDNCDVRAYLLGIKALLNHHRGTVECWEEPHAHRSYNSGSMRAIRDLDQSDPYTTITYLSFAHTGAKILDGLINPQSGSALTEIRNRSQIDEIAAAVGDRKIDALIISAGINDLEFSDVLSKWYMENITEGTIQVREIEARIDQLSRKYKALDHKLTQKLNVKPEDIIITEYPEDLFSSQSADGFITTGGCKGFDEYLMYEGILQREALILLPLASRLNNEIREASARFGWNYVDGISDAFLGHGYCSSDPYFVSMEESCNRQADILGTAHPNAKGHEVVKRFVKPKLIDVLRN